MSLSKFNSKLFKARVARKISQFRIAILLLSLTFILSGVTVIAWFSGEGKISQIFAQINFWQQHPPMWLQVPMVMGEYLIAPTVVLLLIVFFIAKTFPQPGVWSRRLIVGILIVLTLRYVIWRTVATLNPFGKGFKVTPKGTASDRYNFNWNLALPLILLFIATTVSLWRNLGMSMIKGAWAITVAPEVALQIKGIGLGWLWSAYNLIMIAIALLILLDAPKPDVYEWFDLRRVVRLNIGEDALWGVTTIISEVGAQVALTQKPTINLVENMPIKLTIAEEDLQLDAQIVRTGFKDEFPTVRVTFESVNLSQHRCLVNMLFCRPGQWKRNNTPGELSSLLLIFRILLKPRILFDRNIDVSAIALAKV